MGRTTEIKSNHPLWSMLHNAVEKCHCPTHPRYSDYGGRGIRVCPSWYDAEAGRYNVDSFGRWAQSHGYEPGNGLRLGRKDPDGNYSPQNCVLTTAHEGSRLRRSVVKVTIGGMAKCAKDWCAISGIPYHSFCDRRKAGWGDDALSATVPVGIRRTELAKMNPPFDPSRDNPRVLAYLEEMRQNRP